MTHEAIQAQPRVEITAADITGAKSARAVHPAIYAMATAIGRALSDVIETDSKGRPAFRPVAPVDGVEWHIGIETRGGTDFRFALPEDAAEWLDQSLAAAWRLAVREHSDWHPMQPFAFELPELRDATDQVTICGHGFVPWRTDTHS